MFNRFQTIVYYTVAFLFYSISILPFPVIYFLSTVFRFFLFDVFRYRRDVILTNLRCSFPDKTDNEIRKIADRFSAFFCDMLLESIKMASMSREQILKRMVLKNYELVGDYLQQGRSVIGAVGHYCNWEWGGLFQGIKTYESPVFIVYKKLSNHYLDDLLKKVRSRFGCTMIPMELAFRKVISEKGKPWLLLLASDQIPASSYSNHWIPFLNQDTNVFLGVEKIAKKMNSVVVYCEIQLLKRGYYECSYQLLCDKPLETEEYEITNMHMNCLEKQIKGQPEYWLWTHRRWKRGRQINAIS